VVARSGHDGQNINVSAARLPDDSNYVTTMPSASTRRDGPDPTPKACHPQVARCFFESASCSSREFVTPPRFNLPNAWGSAAHTGGCFTYSLRMVNRRSHVNPLGEAGLQRAVSTQFRGGTGRRTMWSKYPDGKISSDLSLVLNHGCGTFFFPLARRLNDPPILGLPLHQLAHTPAFKQVRMHGGLHGCVRIGPRTRYRLLSCSRSEDDCDPTAARSRPPFFPPMQADRKDTTG